MSQAADLDRPSPGPRSLRLGFAAQGLVGGYLAYLAASQVGIGLPWRLDELTLPFALVLGVVAMSLGPRGRLAGWGLLAALVGLHAVVSYTPLASLLLDRLVVDDGPVPADVIVVLSGSTYPEHFMTASENRWLHGVRLLHRGVAPAIVFTGEPGQRHNQFHRLGPAAMADLGLDTSAVVPFESIGQRPMNTRGEALSVAAMADARGWRRVLVVTSPSHTRRARAVFRAAGLEAYVAACDPSYYDLDDLRPGGDRQEAFADVVYEALALTIYRLRGWL